MQELLSLQGKAVLVTGAGSGLGEAVARAFAESGCMIACVDVNREAIERVSASLGSKDAPSIALPCDVSNASAVFATVQQAAEQLGRLDILVNCAAVDYTYSIEELSVEQWDRELNVNLRGPFLFAKAAWPHLKRQGGGHVFNVASTAALRSWANATPYHASKRGLVGLSQGLSVEGREHNIRVTTIIPGGMKTHFFDRFVDQGIPMPDPKNLQDPEIVATTIVFAARVPETSAIQELLITPSNETSWP
jgi:NAD(P)-dependent dehydrogenase (short-subunit alcohol dehydrogenase family)